MTTIHYTPPPDDAPEYVLALDPNVPNRWLDRPSCWVRRFWGKSYTAWREQPPLPAPVDRQTAEAYTPEQIERAMRPYYHDKHIEWVLAALRDGEGE